MAEDTTKPDQQPTSEAEEQDDEEPRPKKAALPNDPENPSEAKEGAVDEAVDETFPASDPPSWMP